MTPRGTEHHSPSIIELFSQTRCFAGTLARERDGYSICRDWHTGDRGNGEERWMVDADFSFVVTTPVCSCQARNYRVDVLEVNASVLNVFRTPFPKLLYLQSDILLSGDARVFWKSKTSQTSPKAKLHRLKVVWVVWKYSTRVFKSEHYSSSLQCFMSTRHVEVLRAALANHVRVTLSLVFRFFCVSRVLWDESHWF